MLNRLLLVSFFLLALFLLGSQWAFSRIMQKAHLTEGPIQELLRGQFGKSLQIETKPWKSRLFLRASTPALSVAYDGSSLISLYRVEVKIELWPSILKGEVLLTTKALVKDKVQTAELLLSPRSFFYDPKSAITQSKIRFQEIQLQPWLELGLRTSSLSALSKVLDKSLISLEGGTQSTEIGSWSINLTRVEGRLIPQEERSAFACPNMKAILNLNNGYWTLADPFRCEDKSSGLVLSLEKPSSETPLRFELNLGKLPNSIARPYLITWGCQNPGPRIRWIWEKQNFVCSN